MIEIVKTELKLTVYCPHCHNEQLELKIDLDVESTKTKCEVCDELFIFET